MKYMQNGGFQNNPMMRLTLLWTGVLLTGFWITNFYFYFSKMGLTPASIVAYYNGSEVLFTQPRTFQSMLKVTHAHLPMMAIVMLLLTHLLIFAPMVDRVKILFISLGFGSALLNEMAGWLIRFVHPGFAPLKIVSFLTLQAILAYLLLGLAMYLLRRPMPEPTPRRTPRRS